MATFSMYGARITTTGDEAGCKAYLGETRRALEQLRTLGFPTLPARRFEDGTTIKVWTGGGFWFASIHKPHPGGKPDPRKPIRPEETVWLYLRGYAEGPPNDDLDVYFIYDWRLKFRGVRKKLRKHLFVENTAEIEEMDYSITPTSEPTITTTNMAPYLGGPWFTVTSGVESETQSGSQRVTHNGSTVLTGTSSGSTTSTYSNDYPPGGDVETVTQDGTTITSGSGTKLPLSAYGTPFLGPVLFAYDYTQYSEYYSELVFTRTWVVNDPPVPSRWWNPTSLDNSGSHFSTESYITYGFINIGAGFESTGGEYVAVAQNSAAALRQGAPWYEKEENGEIVRYAKPAKSDVLLAAYFPAADMVLQCIHKGKVVRSAPIPNGVKEYKGREYALYVPGVEGSPPQCEFGLCTMPIEWLEADRDHIPLVTKKA